MVFLWKGAGTIVLILSSVPSVLSHGMLLIEPSRRPADGRYGKPKPSLPTPSIPSGYETITFQTSKSSTLSQLEKLVLILWNTIFVSLKTRKPINNWISWSWLGSMAWRNKITQFTYLTSRLSYPCCWGHYGLKVWASYIQEVTQFTILLAPGANTVFLQPEYEH